MEIESIKTKGFAVSLIAFPVMLLAGFLMHPDLLKFEVLQAVEQLVGRFHNQPMFHIGHLIVMFAVPVIMISMIRIMNLLQGKDRSLGFSDRMKCSLKVCPLYGTKQVKEFK